MIIEADERMKATDRAGAAILEQLGAAEMLDAVLMALNYDTKREIFDYIARMYDITEDGQT